MPSKVITVCCIGKTGDGKSTCLNRLAGDTSLRGRQGPFKTSNSSQSCTTDPTLKEITLNFGNNSGLKKFNGYKMRLIDTPGLADTEGRDKKFSEKLIDFFEKTAKGVNVFLIVLNVTNIRFDGFTRVLLKALAITFGKDMWKHVLLVFTRVDARGYNKEDYDMAKDHWPFEIRKALTTGVIPPTTPVGFENYEGFVKDVITFGLSKKPYQCKEMEVWNGFGDMTQFNKVKNELNRLQQLVNNLKAKEKEFENMKKDYERLKNKMKCIGINNICFKKNYGIICVNKLNIGDEILCYNIKNNNIEYSKIWRISKHEGKTKLYKIIYQINNKEYNITLTQGHYVFNDNNNCIIPQNLKIGDKILINTCTDTGNNVNLIEIKKINII